MRTSRQSRSEDTALRIIDVAEELFRRVGYAKTAVADIARELDMSPANVYRFFPSKAAINEAIAERFLDEIGVRLRAIASADAPAGERIERFLHEQKLRYERECAFSVGAVEHRLMRLVTAHIDEASRV